MTSFCLPSDLVMEIMSRVPCKYLARLRLGSKQFRSLLSDHGFLRLHHKRTRDSLFSTEVVVNNKSLHVFPSYFHPMAQTEYDISVRNKSNCLVHQFKEYLCGITRIRTLSSHHQLLCFVSESRISLCNPVKMELKNLPDPPCFPRRFNGSEECVSFGFVEATMQYKVVIWLHDLDEYHTRRLPSGLVKEVNKLEFEVLNIDIVEDGRLKLSPWRILHRPCPYLLQISSQVHVNGIIYWTTSDFQIVSFSLRDETFSLNPKPPCFCLDAQGSKESHFFTLSGSRGNLWMLHYSVYFMDIWKMEDIQGRRWDKIHKINLRGVHPNDIDGKVHIIDIRSDEVHFRLSPTCLLCFDAKKKTLLNYGKGSRDYQTCHSTDGLLSLHNMDMSNFEPCSSRSSFR